MYRKIATDTIAIGVEDNDLRLFEHQYPLTDGITYNSYMISDDGITVVIDGVDSRCGKWWLDNIDGEGKRHVDYLIVQHAEPDHSSTINQFLKIHPETTVVATRQALKIMYNFFKDMTADSPTLAVNDGDVLPIGRHKLTFMTAPMVHWPEVMVTYDEFSGILFTADAFGTFGVSNSIGRLWPDEARRYYTNIVGKYGQSVQRLLEKVSKLSEIKIVAPLHGPVINSKDLETPLSLYGNWSTYTPEIPEGVFVAYASIYGNTADVALKCVSLLRKSGIEVSVIDLCEFDVSYAVAQAFRMGKIIIAAPTYDGALFPAMYNFLHHLQSKGLKNRTYAIIENGSWAPVAGKIMKEMIMKMSGSFVIEPMLTIKSAFADEQVSQLDNLIKALKNNG